MTVEFVKYNRGRLPQYRTETAIISEGDRHFVRKRPLGAEAVPHVREMVGKQVLLRRLNGANIPAVRLQSDSIIMDFVEGESYEGKLLHYLMSKDQVGFKHLLEQYVALLHSYGLENIGRYVPSGELRRLFPEGYEAHGVQCMRLANLDLTFDNLIVDPKGKVWVTDYEWVFDEPIPVTFIIFRSLYVFILKHGDRLGAITEFDMLEWTGLHGDDREVYQAACERFIDMVHGAARPNLVPDTMLKTIHSLSPAEELESVKVRLEVKEGELASAYAMLQHREEMMLEREAELEELWGRIRAEEELVVSVKKDAKRFADIENRLMILRRDLSQKVVEVDHHLITEEVPDIDAVEALMRAMVGQKELDRIRIETYGREVADLYSMLSELRANVEREQASAIQLNEQLARKQKELMTMSDWAFTMKQRLEFIDSSPSVLRAERWAKFRRSAMDTYKAEGVRGVAKGFVRQRMPGLAHDSATHQVPADLQELRTSLRANRGRLLVIFPIIPWEFRWQRPQQIVSRFAKDGYAVLFVNMTLNPKGRVYKNEAEAQADLKIGKLDDNIYQSWLYTENRINVYQDHIKGGDLTNMLLGLRAILDEVEPDEIIYGVQFPGWTDLAMALRKKHPGKMVFDCMDEHAGFSNNNQTMLKDEEKLLRQSDLVITTSDKLFAKAKAQNDSVVMVRNGTDFEMFRDSQPNGELDKLARPFIGYYGAISEWFDTGLVEFSARKHPEWNFILIGSTVGCDVSQLEKLPNVRLLGEKPYKTLPGYLAYFDVCTIPFKLNPLTNATNPVKFYEYLSAGKPVVTVPLPELKPFADLCYLADGKEQFDEMLQRAVAEKDEELVRKRIAFAQVNSWNERYRMIRRALDEL